MATATSPEGQGGDCPQLDVHDLKDNQLDLEEKVEFRPREDFSEDFSDKLSCPQYQDKVDVGVQSVAAPGPGSLPKDSEATALPVTLPLPRTTVYTSDRVIKLNMDGELTFGFIVIRLEDETVVVDWDDGRDEHLGFLDGNRIGILNKMGILDRRAVGFGSKVISDEGRIGQVVEKRFLISLALESNPNVVIVDVDSEDLIRPGYSKMGDKIFYGEEWVGLTADTRAGIYFKMDKDGKLGYVPDDSYGFVFPRIGDKLKNMMIYHLWDTKWITTEQKWWWNFLKYLGNTSTILDTKIDCMTIAWMGHVDRGSVCKEEEKALPPNTLRHTDDLKEIQHLYGRNWKYAREHDSWDYKIKKDDKIMNFHDYVVQLSNNMFFGPDEDYIDLGSSGDDVKGLDLEHEKPVAVRVVCSRSIVDIEWDDGTMDTLPSYRVKPYQYVGSDSTSYYFVGNIVCQLATSDDEKTNESLYGFIVRVYQTTALVKWVIPDPDYPKISTYTVNLSEIKLHPNYLFLKSLYQLPVVISKVKNPAGKRIAVDGIKIGVTVGVNVAEAKLKVKCTDGVERLVWAHDFEHFEGDVANDEAENKWIPWYKMDKNKNAIMSTCRAERCLRLKHPPPTLIGAVLEPVREDAIPPVPKLVKLLQALYSP